ncbi:hypothetical protein, partial [Escherichia coli]|uniref:hypothetical protein n=1 Tax=Escherichia coli TaxID=562 RepID=UPI001BC84B83
WKGWAILLRQKQKKLIMLPSETMIWQPEFTDKTLSRKPGAVHPGLFSHQRFLTVLRFQPVAVKMSRYKASVLPNPSFTG